MRGGTQGRSARLLRHRMARPSCVGGKGRPAGGGWARGNETRAIGPARCATREHCGASAGVTRSAGRRGRAGAVPGPRALPDSSSGSCSSGFVALATTSAAMSITRRPRFRAADLSCSNAWRGRMRWRSASTPIACSTRIRAVSACSSWPTVVRSRCASSSIVGGALRGAGAVLPAALPGRPVRRRAPRGLRPGRGRDRPAGCRWAARRRAGRPAPWRRSGRAARRRRPASRPRCGGPQRPRPPRAGGR